MTAKRDEVRQPDVVIPGLRLVEEAPGVYFEINENGDGISSARYDAEGHRLKPWVPPTISTPQVRPVPEGWEWRVSLRHDFDAEMPEGRYRSPLQLYPADWADGVWPNYMASMSRDHAFRLDDLAHGFAHSRADAERRARRAAEVGDADWDDV